MNTLWIIRGWFIRLIKKPLTQRTNSKRTSRFKMEAMDQLIHWGRMKWHLKKMKKIELLEIFKLLNMIQNYNLGAWRPTISSIPRIIICQEKGPTRQSDLAAEQFRKIIRLAICTFWIIKITTMIERRRIHNNKSLMIAKSYLWLTLTSKTTLKQIINKDLPKTN